jgi:hypothetical protein
MNEQQPAERSPGPASAATTHPPAVLLDEAERKRTVIVGGLLAGLGLSVAVALLMHVVQEASPNGYAMNIDGSVLLELLVAGPVFGLGLALALTALIPSSSTGGPPASAGPANPVEQPADA